MCPPPPSSPQHVAPPSALRAVALWLWALIDHIPRAGLPLASSAARGDSWLSSGKTTADRCSCHLYFSLRPCPLISWCPPTDRAKSMLPYVGRREAPEPRMTAPLLRGPGSPLPGALQFGFTAKPLGLWVSWSLSPPAPAFDAAGLGPLGIGPPAPPLTTRRDFRVPKPGAVHPGSTLEPPQSLTTHRSGHLREGPRESVEKHCFKLPTPRPPARGPEPATAQVRGSAAKFRPFK